VITCHPNMRILLESAAAQLVKVFQQALFTKPCLFADHTQVMSGGAGPSNAQDQRRAQISA
jgi:hypothetical protein